MRTVSKKSDLAAALESGNRKEVDRVFSETTARFNQLYSEEHRNWFAAAAKREGAP